MRMQSSAANCGPYSLKNGLAALGVVRSEQECESLCGVTAADGTSDKQLLRALRKIDGLTPVVVYESRQDVALLKVRHALTSGRPVILLVDNSTHWVVAVGMLGNRYLVTDSADSELVLSMDVEELVNRWAIDGAKKPYYGIAL